MFRIKYYSFFSFVVASLLCCPHAHSIQSRYLTASLGAIIRLLYREVLWSGSALRRLFSGFTKFVG